MQKNQGTNNSTKSLNQLEQTQTQTTCSGVKQNKKSIVEYELMFITICAKNWKIIESYKI